MKLGNHINNEYVQIIDVCKSFNNGETKIAAADHLNFSIQKGEFVMIMGPSGSGKTTLLNMIGGMDSADSGHIIVDNEDITTYSKNKLANYRANMVGFVYQFYNLLPNLTTKENIKLACDAARVKCDVEKYIHLVGLDEYTNTFPSKMSGGQQQRVSIARAIAKHPKILLCDEPTGALDIKNSNSVLRLLRKITDYGATILMVTHNLQFADFADRVIIIEDGKVKGEQIATSGSSSSALEDTILV